ncbi:peroxisomal carnitine O-octanoyltransferase-like [Glandiceps talaboti]
MIRLLTRVSALRPKSLLRHVPVSSSTMMAMSTEEKTFLNEDTLPSLPVPPLQETLTKYLESVKPHVNQDEYKKTHHIVKTFGDGIGKKLHEKLLEKAKNERNWIEKWWENGVYLTLRGSTVLNSNFGGYFPTVEDIWPPTEGVQLERCALLLYFNMKFWELLRKEQLPLERERLGDKALSMIQYKSLYNTCKIPRNQMDRLDRYFKSEFEGDCPSHIIVLRNGHYYTFDIVDKDGEIITAPEMQRQLEYIKDKCDSDPSVPNIGTMTALDREPWKEARDHLIKIDPKNEERLKCIEKSIFLIAIENTAPEMSELCKHALCGDVNSRFYDKSYQLASHRNGTFSLNADHAAYDGLTLLGSAYYARMQIEQQDGKWQGPTEVRDLPLPEELKFTIDDKILTKIQQGYEQHHRETSNVTILDSQPKFDRGLLKSKRIHPDAFIQSAIQLTYYKLHGKPGPTYETATTRQFYHGRTETVRTCTVENIEFCKAMLDKNASAQVKLELLNKAAAKHLQMMNECKNNAGCDRHLFGLQMIALENGIPLPDIYLDESYVKSGGNGNFILSSSLNGYSALHGLVAPMCANGYGAFYSILQKDLRLVVSSWNSDADTNSTVFTETFENNVQEMLALVSTAKL